MKIGPKCKDQKKNPSFFQVFYFLFFVFFPFKSIKVLELQTTSTLQLCCSTMCLRGLLLLKYSHSLKKKKSIFIVQPCVVHGLPTIDQIFSFIKIKN